MAKLSWNKWSKYKVLMKSRALTAYLPETHWVRDNALWTMLEKHKHVILKPSGSYGGNGVMLISTEDNHHYKVHTENIIRTFIDRNELAQYINKKLSRKYIVQQRIPLARINECPFDLRVMVQRRTSNWAVTGKLAKVAGRGYIITNLARSKGRLLAVDKAIQQSTLGDSIRNELMAKIDEVALSVANHLNEYYPSVRTMGIDMGIGDDGHLWIIEVNFAPSISLFRKLKDHKMYQRILSYRKKAVGS